MAKRHSNKRAQIEAVAYYRMSSDRQEKSVAEQRSAVRKWAKQNGYRILHEYVDEGISGVDTAKRVEFQRMHADSMSKRWSAILCWNQDRFGRFDSTEAGFWIFPLRKAGIHLATVTQGKIDWNSFEGRVTYTVQQEGKHMYLQDMSKNLLRTKQEAASRGELFSTLPLGYKKADPKIAPDENAHLVVWTFQAFADGVTVKAIAEYLHAHGARDKKGSLFCPSRIRRMLVNPIYIGRYEWGKKKQSKFNSADGLVVIEDNHPPIVDRDLFDKVQRLFKKRKRKTAHTGEQRPLSCILRCECGRTMAVANNTGRKGVYRCKGQYYGRTCKGFRVERQLVEGAVLDAISNTFTDPDLRAEVRAETAKEINRREASARKAPGDTQKRLCKLRKKLHQAEQRLFEVPSDLMDGAVEVVRGYKAELRAAEADHEAAQAAQGMRSAKDIQAEQEEIFKILANLRDSVSDLPGPEANRVLTQLIDHIDVDMEVSASRKGMKAGESRYRLQGGTIHLAQSLGVLMALPSPRLIDRPMSGRKRP